MRFLIWRIGEFAENHQKTGKHCDIVLCIYMRSVSVVAKFNARQIFPLYGNIIATFIVINVLHAYRRIISNILEYRI